LSKLEPLEKIELDGEKKNAKAMPKKIVKSLIKRLFTYIIAIGIFVASIFSNMTENIQITEFKINTSNISGHGI
jgi:hypothetical protein